MYVANCPEYDVKWMIPEVQASSFPFLDVPRFRILGTL